MKKLWVACITLCGLSACTDNATQQYLDNDGIPKPTTYYVNDFTGTMLDTAQISFLNKELRHYEDSTSNQIVVILLNEIPKNKNGDSWALEDFTLETARTWKIGQNGKNNGVLFFAALNDKKDRIEVGYGLEGALPDVICKHILDHEVKPQFKDEHYYQGVKDAINAIERSISGEYQQEVHQQEVLNSFWLWYLIALGICALISAFMPGYWIVALITGALCGGIGWHLQWELWNQTIIAGLIGAIAVLVAATIFRAGTVGMDGDGDGFLLSGGGGSGGGGGFLGGGGSFGGGGASGGW